ncbi:hypothetical protein T440DRAFT_471251 [Plenodomus tracheiphilus IPT5]|uniref:Ribosomal protein/NADH dehydrogenase domain-containing protein n=1 Tax=Plenodomus tracheiphilus IPT5 TaxID=1408161 RepID=A0A6A7AXQ3_9PLEO|nr:hypothetical protein T440DRAFT_471251 [Plenodomus tracheiphilus IPT5]
MEFNTKIYGGHRGARKFWREMLPRIKYRNPAIPIEVNRHSDPSGPSLLHIYTHTKTQPTSSTTASPVAQQSANTPPSATPNARNTMVPDTTPPTYTLNIRDQQEGEILEAFVKTLECEEVKPSPEEEQQMRDLKEQEERSEQDRVLMRETLLKERREAEMLKLARGEAAEAVA